MNFKKIKKIVTALAFTVMLGATTSTIHALPVPKGTEIPELQISKILNLPAEGVTTPKETFTFNFEKHSIDGDTTNTGNMPDLSAKVEYTAADTTDADQAREGKQVEKTTTTFMNGPKAFPKVGQFTYKVTENNATATEGMTYATTSYLVSIFTEQNKDGAIVVSSVQVQKDGQGKKEAINQEKGLVFENTYVKQGEFSLTKVLEGDLTGTDNKFPFSFTITAPAGSTATEFKYNNPENGTEMTGQYGTPVEVKLTGDQTVTFKEVVLGSKVAAEETDSLGYTPSIKAATINGKTGITLDNLKAGQIIGDEGNNSVEFLNTQQTPTGILLDNLPFIVLAVLAGTGIIFFVKNRNNEEEMEA